MKEQSRCKDVERCRGAGVQACRVRCRAGAEVQRCRGVEEVQVKLQRCRAGADMEVLRC